MIVAMQMLLFMFIAVADKPLKSGLAHSRNHGIELPLAESRSKAEKEKHVILRKKKTAKRIVPNQYFLSAFITHNPIIP